MLFGGQQIVASSTLRLGNLKQAHYSLHLHSNQIGALHVEATSQSQAGISPLTR